MLLIVSLGSSSLPCKFDKSNILYWVSDRLTSLYILGLYRNNSVNLMPFLFSVDYFVVLYYSMVSFHSYSISINHHSSSSLFSYSRFRNKPMLAGQQTALGIYIWLERTSKAHVLQCRRSATLWLVFFYIRIAPFSVLRSFSSSDNASLHPSDTFTLWPPT